MTGTYGVKNSERVSSLIFFNSEKNREKTYEREKKRNTTEANQLN